MTPAGSERIQVFLETRAAAAGGGHVYFLHSKNLKAFNLPERNGCMIKCKNFYPERSK